MQNVVPLKTDLKPEERLSTAVKVWLSATAQRRDDEEHGIVEWQRVPVPELSESERQAALASLESACRPMAKSDIAALLGRVRGLTAARAEGDVSTAIRIEMYTEELALWPGDVVAHVLQTQPKVSKFWPAWQELEERLELYAGKRMRALKMLRDG